MSGTARLREIRNKMHQRNPRCYYCEVVTVLPHNLPERRRNVRDTPHMATIDHIFSRLNPLRQHEMRGFERYRLACAKCNNERANQEAQEELTLDQLHKMSGRYPRASSDQ